jgi:hypothetical protein
MRAFGRQTRLWQDLRPAARYENETISIMPFLLRRFSPGDKIENCSAQFLSVC